MRYFVQGLRHILFYVFKFIFPASSAKTFLDLCRARGFQVEHGAFGADMAVQSVNDGPVTIWMDTETL